MYEEYEDYDLPVNRHRKVVKSNSPKPKKSKHKHQYVSCTFKCPSDALGRMRWSFWDGKYCSICGKIQVENMLLDEEPEDAIVIGDVFQKEIKV